MTKRLTILSDPHFADLRPTLSGRMRAASAQLSAENFESFLDSSLLSVLRDGFDQAGAHEGMVWLAESDALVAAFNTGPHAAKLVGSVRQPLSAGLISLVFASEQAICENRVYLNAEQDPTVDRKLGVRTWAMIATPLYVAYEIRGVISCVQLIDPALPETHPKPAGFGPENLCSVGAMASVFSQLLDFRLLSSITGWGYGGLS